MQSLKKVNLKDLYNEDYLAWYEVTLEQIKRKNITDLDLDSLKEVLENLVRDIKRSGESYLKQIIIHLLLIEYWDSEKINHRHWAAEITNFRDELETDMTNNLRKHLEKERENIYKKSVKYVLIKTGLNKKIFPNQCPYTLVQLLDDNWFPHNIDLTKFYP
ncbi:DUF29 domain-containing protein [Geminocystis sp. NIES-3709]|uniref:DUF29 domain-containing protein n=1 Tax=Geminocystis sp. NIES-3709 TaxID=1617448 RepID=UPI0005FCA373|nr:DUF29 domain-containing protein [Geminocystis sp. NIES-3709]BAQ65968.1 hypothetical protein GM3709_2733 [Geminocystis sp. NIES-3709]